MRCAGLLPLGLAIALGLVSCSFFTDGVEPDVDAPPDTSQAGRLVVTDGAPYTARVHVLAGGHAQVEMAIPYEIRNTTGGPLYRIGCKYAPQPALERRVDGAWVLAYEVISRLCLSPPFAIEAGGVQQETLRVAVAMQGQRTAPSYQVPVPGTYRLNAPLYATLREQPSLGGGMSLFGDSLLPEAERTSASFEVRFEAPPSRLVVGEGPHTALVLTDGRGRVVVGGREIYDARDRAVFDLPYTLVNHGAEPLYDVICNDRLQATLEKRVGEAWQPVVEPEPCAAPEVLRIGGLSAQPTVYRLSVYLEEAAPIAHPADVAGTYRLRRQLYARRTASGAVEASSLLPVAERVSQPFEVTVRA